MRIWMCTNKPLKYLSKVQSLLTYWGHVMHICVSKLTIIGLDNGLLPDRHQAIIWTNDRSLLIGRLGTNLNWFFFPISYIFIQENAFENFWKMASVLSRPQSVKALLHIAYRIVSISSMTKWMNSLESLSRVSCQKGPTRHALLAGYPRYMFCLAYAPLVYANILAENDLLPEWVTAA